MAARKGLEPIIAVMILLVLTLAISTIIIGWAGNITKEKKEVFDKQATELDECAGAAVAIQKIYADANGNISKVDWQNVGTREIFVEELRIVGSNATCTIEFGEENNTAHLGSFNSTSITGCQIKCENYQSTTLQTTCDDIRAVHLKSGKVVGCPE